MSFHHSGVDRPLRMVVLFIAVACAALGFSCSTYESPVDAEETAVSNDFYPAKNTAAGKEWTFLLYAASDVGMTWAPLTTFAEHFASGPGVDALCLQDKNGETAKMWYIDGDHNTVLLEDIGEVNMGSVTTLTDFLEYAMTNYPAERYIISFYGHGGGWGGACNDMDPEFGVLRMDDMKQALQGAGGVDLVLFSAPCWMGALESAYELRGCTDVYIASEHLSGYMFWTDVMSSISEELNSNPNIANLKLSRLILDWMKKDRKNYAPYRGMQYLTMSAIRMDRMDALREAIDDLALAYLVDPARLKMQLETVRKKIVYFDNTSITDLNSILQLLLKVETDVSIRTKLETVAQRLSDAVIAEMHLGKYKDAGGLTIFLPDEATADVLAYYVHEMFGLDFVLDSHWDELLAELFPEAAAFDMDRTLEEVFEALWVEPVQSKPDGSLPRFSSSR
jgi:hypothetical protein